MVELCTCVMVSHVVVDCNMAQSKSLDLSATCLLSNWLNVFWAAPTSSCRHSLFNGPILVRAEVIDSFVEWGLKRSVSIKLKAVHIYTSCGWCLPRQSISFKNCVGLSTLHVQLCLRLKQFDNEPKISIQISEGTGTPVPRKTISSGGDQ